MRGFEPPTPWSVAKCSIQLSYTHSLIAVKDITTKSGVCQELLCCHFLFLHSLQNEHRSEQCDADDIGHRSRVDHHQAAGDEEQPLHRVAGGPEISGGAGGKSHHADDGGAHREEHVSEEYRCGPAAGIHQDHDRVQHEHVGHQVSGDAETHGVESGAHGIGACNAGACEGCQSHGRGDISHDAEVEHEEVGRDGGGPQNRFFDT